MEVAGKAFPARVVYISKFVNSTQDLVGRQANKGVRGLKACNSGLKL
jgi:hypothetical protein